MLLLSVLGSVADAQMKLGEPAVSASPTPAIRDIRPPLDVFPYPMWMIVTAGVIALALLGFIITGIVMAAKRRPKTPPPTPRELALHRLKEAEADLARTEPYAFSIRVSDILRRYVSEQYELRATEQTSPEFLAAAARSPHFTKSDKDLLANFLERCDLIKFAHVDATTEDSAGLLEQAVCFVKGGAA
jgi:hypothetical protein